jgi:hypothetical protein
MPVFFDAEDRMDLADANLELLDLTYAAMPGGEGEGCFAYAAEPGGQGEGCFAYAAEFGDAGEGAGCLAYAAKPGGLGDVVPVSRAD